MTENLFTLRKPLMEIVEIPRKVTSVYSMVQHIWEGDTDAARQKSRKNGKVRLATLEEYFLDPVRSYIERFMQDVADGEGQGYWLLAHFGVGKSHLMAVESVLALGGDDAWDIVKRKEDEVKNLGPAARLDRFRSSVGPKKIFPIIFTLEGKGGGTTENRLVDFILAEAASLYELRTGKPLAVTPAHHLADWYLSKGRSDFEGSLRAFVANKQAMENLPKFDNYSSLLSALQDPDSAEDGAMVLRGFLRSKDVRVDTRTEPAELLKHAFHYILDSGYDGILVAIDEMSEYMNKTRYPHDDEDCLLTISSVLAKGEKMPIWTIVAAQAQYQKQDKIVGQDRMREELLDHKPERFRNIVVNRCRQYRLVKGKSQAPETHNYYLGYKETIPWVKAGEEDTFRGCFPFPPEAIQVIQAISQKLTGTRSTIAFLHAALRRIRDHEAQWNELVPLYRIFAELLDYAENPSNSDSGSLSVKSVSEFRDGVAALESAKKKLSKIETGQLGKKAGKRRGERILVTLFLYRIAGFGGLTTAQILDAVSDLKGEDGLDIQLDYYEGLLKELKTELRGQIREADGKFEFVPKETGEFDDVVQQAVEKLKTDSVVFWSYFDKLLEYSQDAYKSPFSDYRGNALVRADIVWHGQKRVGHVCFRDLSIKGGQPPRIETASNEADFVIVLSRRPVKDAVGRDYLKSSDPKSPDPRAILWVPAELTDDQKTGLINVLAYLKVEEDYPATKYAKDARASFQLHCQTAYDLLRQLYEQGKARTTRKTLTVDWTGGLDGALERLAGDTLDECYRAAGINTKPRNFGTDEAVKLINGLVKLGQSVPVNDSLHSAVDNFAGPLKLVRAPHLDRLDPTTSDAFKEIRTFAESKAGHPVLMSVFYNQFTGWRPEDGAKSWGLTRRMVDIYLLAMVQMGIVRINLKKGDPIDRNSIQGADFRLDTLRSFETVELPKALFDWDRLSPFLEIMAGTPKGEYGPNYDQVTARKALDNLRGVWAPSDRIESLLTRVSDLFREINQKDPYDELLQFWMEFFSDALPAGSDSDVFEFFKAALLKTLNRDSAEDLTGSDETSFGSNWWRLQALQEHFDDQSVLVRCAGSYSRMTVPDVVEYKSLGKAVSALESLVTRAKEFLVDPDLTNAQLRPGLEAVWKEHDGPFLHGTQAVNEALSDLKTNAELARTSPEFKVVAGLSGAVPESKLALAAAQQELAGMVTAIVRPLSSSDECKRRLRIRASITVSNGAEIHLKDLRPLRDDLQAKADACAGLPAEALLRVARFLCDEQVRVKLQPHADKEVIACMLALMSPEGLAQYLLKRTKAEIEQLAKVLDAVLKGIEFFTIQLSDFRPTRSVIWSDDEVDAVVGEFEDFLRANAKGKVVKLV